MAYINFMKAEQILVVVAVAVAAVVVVVVTTTLGVIDISNIIDYFDHSKSSSISQLMNSKSRYPKKSLNYFSGATTYMPSVLL